MINWDKTRIDVLLTPEFGDPILVKGKLKRSKPGNKRVWLRETYDPPTKAIFLGKRTLSNGHTEYDIEDGPWFNPDEYLKGALICEKGRKPRYVLMEDIFIIPCESNEPPSIYSMMRDLWERTFGKV
jgi:hypothetical protein